MTRRIQVTRPDTRGRAKRCWHPIRAFLSRTRTMRCPTIEPLRDEPLCSGMLARCSRFCIPTCRSGPVLVKCPLVGAVFGRNDPLSCTAAHRLPVLTPDARCAVHDAVSARRLLEKSQRRSDPLVIKSRGSGHPPHDTSRAVASTATIDPGGRPVVTDSTHRGRHGDAEARVGDRTIPFESVITWFIARPPRDPFRAPHHRGSMIA